MTPVEDTIDAALRPDAALTALRDRRDVVRLESQLSHDALLGALASGGLSSQERFAVAARVASLHESEALAADYLRRVPPPGAGADAGERSARLEAMLRHAELLSTDPAQAGPAPLAALAGAGLTAAEIVTLSQLIGFVSYQVRVVAGLALLQKQEAAA